MDFPRLGEHKIKKNTSSRRLKGPGKPERFCNEIFKREAVELGMRPGKTLKKMQRVL